MTMAVEVKNAAMNAGLAHKIMVEVLRTFD